jgi:hypothetical protein
MSINHSDLLLLDSAIRDWVLLPIAIVMFVTSLLRHHTTILMRKTPQADISQLQCVNDVINAFFFSSYGFFQIESNSSSRRFCSRSRQRVATRRV